MYENTTDATWRLRLVGTGQSLIRHDIRDHTTPAFLQVRDRVRAADVAFTNYETALAVPGDPLPVMSWKNVPPRPASPETIESLRWLGFDLLSLANNHANDGGPNGVTLTKRTALDLGFTPAGTGETLAEAQAPAVRTVGEVTVAFVAMDSANLQTRDAIAGTDGLPGVNPMRGERGPDGVEVILDTDDLARNAAVVADAARHADVVVVSLHEHMWPEPVFENVAFEPRWYDHWRAPMAWKRRYGQAMIDAGASAVFCHGTPPASAVEIHRGRPIFHSLGNFIYHATPGTKGWVMDEAWSGFLAEIDITAGRVAAINLLPIRLMALDGSSGSEQADRLVPGFADDAWTRRTMHRVAEDSAELGTRLIETDTGWQVEIPG